MPLARLKRLLFLLVCLAATSHGLAADESPADPSLNLLPWPKSIRQSPGEMVFHDTSRIMFADSSLEPLAGVISEEIFLLSGIRLQIAAGTAATGDIGLVIDPQLKGEAYQLDITDRAVARGGRYDAVALASVTLEQALQQRDNGLRLPLISVSDHPDYRMRAIQMCIKHQIHAISKIKQGVDLCRQFKLNTLALHASNYQMLWMLCPPFRENPLPKGNSDGGETYSLEEMRGLVEYARQRGVVIMPEWGPADFAMPGEMMHWFYKARQFGDYKSFDPAKETLLDNPKFWEAIDDMTRQLAEVFTTTEYLHVGALDGETGHWDTAPDHAFMKAHNLRGSGDVWAWLLKRLYEINKKHGKETMAFEGVSRSAAAQVNLPKEVAFFAYQTWYYSSDQMLADGYRVLNAAWRPLYTVGGYPAREIYAWSPNIVRHNITEDINITLPKSDRLLGPLLSTWEGTEIGHLELLSDRGAAMAERCWNESAGRTWDDFNRRLAPVMAALSAIQFPMGVQVDGAIKDVSFLPLDHRWAAGTVCYADKLSITMKPRRPDVKIYYTLTDPYFIWSPNRPSPSSKSPDNKLYEGPISNPEGIFRAQCFDAAGRPVGGEFVKIFQRTPIQIAVEGADEKYDELGRSRGRSFHGKAVVKFSTIGDAKLFFRTTPPDGKPDMEYTGPITIHQTTRFWVGLVGPDGYPLQTTVGDDGYKQNLLTNDRVKITTDAKDQVGDPNLVCDGKANDPDKHWNGIGEATLTIETAVPRKMNEIHVYCWWGDGRAYRYTVEGSEDGKTWKQLVDWSRNAEPSSPEGYRHRFDTQNVRFLRFRPLGNTTNNHGHLTEICAYDTTNTPP